MPVTRKTFFATPQDAEAAFYEAIERADIESFMALWAEDEEIACISPGGPRLAGYAAIREAWQQVFAGGARLHFRLQTNTTLVNPFTAIHNLLEQISVEGQDGLTAPVIATNIFLRGPLGWRLVLHHASPAPPSAIEPAKVLH